MEMIFPLLIVFSFFYITNCQNNGVDANIEEAVNSIFNASIYEEVTQEPLRGYGALRRCGENERQGLDVCVPYYNCDPDTRTVIQTGTADGFGSIDIRYSEEDNQCDHYLDVCCQIPQNDTLSTSTPITPTTEATLFTSPAIVPSRTPVTSGSGEGTSIRPIENDGGNKPVEDNGGDWETCGIRNVNGIDFKLKGNVKNEAEYGEFPWQVALLRTNYNKEIHGHQCICGGSIIRADVILTAAHCVLGFKPSEVTIRAGEWDTQTTKERIPFQERIARQIISHENYGDGAINDIALILLDRPFIKVKSVGTICLPKASQEATSKHCLASGWGKFNFGKEGAYSVVLKKIELPMVSSTECQRMLRSTRLGPKFRLHRSFTCAGGEEGKDTCTGDGGSPLVCPDPKDMKRYVQTGIVSWGIGCGGKNIPGVYTDVAKFRTWIDRKLRNIASD